MNSKINSEDAARSEVTENLLNHFDKREKNTNKKTYPDLDSLLGFGRFQHFQIWVFQALTATIGAINYMHIFFLVSEPPGWYCDTGSVEKCPADADVCDGAAVHYNTTHENFLDSLVVEHNWVCEKALWGPSVITAFSVGMLFHSLIFGQMCDTIGRVKVMHITNIIFIVFRTASFYFTWHYPTFLVLTALATGYFPVGVRAGYTLVTEYCNESGRKYAYISGWVWWVFGMMVVPFLAEYINDWFKFGLATTLCNIIIILMYPLVPESPRLLCSQKKFESAAKVIALIRKLNKEEEIQNLEEVLKSMQDKVEDKTELGVTSLFKEASLRRLVVSMAVLYSVNDYFYFAGQINAGNLAGNMFVNFALLALTELPSVFIGQFMIDRFGRRWSHVACMFIVTACFTCNIVLVNMDDMGQVVLAFSLAAKTTSNVGWFVMWVQSVEVFPTMVRNSGINFSVVGSIIVGMTTPFVISLDSIDKRLPYVVFVCLGVMGIIATTLIPETKGMQLPDTVTQVDKMFSEMRFFELAPWKRTVKEKEKK